jgi:hypothetical protein
MYAWVTTEIKTRLSGLSSAEHKRDIWFYMCSAYVRYDWALFSRACYALVWTGSMSRKAYPIDVTDEEWHFVAPYLMLMTEDAPQPQHSSLGDLTPAEFASIWQQQQQISAYETPSLFNRYMHYLASRCSSISAAGISYSTLTRVTSV